MFVEVMLRRRAAPDESILELNADLIASLSKLPGFWCEGKTAQDATFDDGEYDDDDGEYDDDDDDSGSTVVFLENALIPGLWGQICYASRLESDFSEDEAMNDDLLTCRLTVEEADYTTFCQQTFPELIKIFQPYRAMIETDQDVGLADWDIVRQDYHVGGPDIDGRDSVYRIWPVNFFDDLLCRRSFGLSAEKVVRRAAPECERAQLIAGGAFLLVTAELVTGAALDPLNQRVQRRLGVRWRSAAPSSSS
jgi:hypothetical protein